MCRAAFFVSQKMLLSFRSAHEQPDGCRSCREAPLRAGRSATHSLTVPLNLLRKFRLTAQQLRFGQVVVTFALLPLTRRCKLTTADNLWKKQFTGLFFLISSCCGGNLLPFKWGVKDERKLSITARAAHSTGACCG